MDKYIGRLLDNRYEILEVIGTGGMAVVYKARCHRLNRLVAIKILKDDFLEDEDFRRRFHSESQAVAMLSHPNIVSVYDVSTSVMADYIVMELIEGISLKQYMEKKGVLNWKETLHFAIQIAKALEHAHSRGIVHRDIKPHNVMVLKNGSVKVTDFGIARMMSKGNTLTKEALGSVHYISPEQAKGGRVDDRSDIYSLGVVMYEMMSGRPPYDGETPVSVAIQHINGGAALPSTMNPNIPGGLEQIIMKAMAHDPAKRFSGAPEMLRDMDEFRRDPAILFDYHGNADEVIRIHKPTITVVPTPGVTPGVGTNSQSAAEATAAKRAKEREQARRRREEEERKRNKVAIIAIATCAAVMILAAIVMMVVILGNDDVQLVEVPDLVGSLYHDGMTIDGLQIEVEFIYDEEPAGTILDQKPDGKKQVELNSTLELTVSQGSEPVLMDNVIGLSEENARSILMSYGLGLEIHTEPVFSNDVAKGYVIDCDVAENTPLEPQQKVTLTISLGNQPVMGNLENMTEEEARKTLQNYGIDLVVTSTTEYSDEVEEGCVISTKPSEGSKLEVGQKVTLMISLGAEVIMEKVPEIVGMTWLDARNALEAKGFKNYDYKYIASAEKENMVVDQSVEKDTEVDVTTKIIIYLSDGKLDPKVTKKVDIALPTLADLEEMQLLPEDYTEGSMITYSMIISQGTTDFYTLTGIELGKDTYVTVELTGTGIQVYEIKVNGQSWKKVEVDFTAE